jgi:hypothetical protein
VLCKVQDIADGIVVAVDVRGIVLQISAWTRDFSLIPNIQTDSEAYSASYSLATEGCFLGAKVAGVMKLTTHRS